MPPDGSSNPLDRTPDMASLTPAERAKIYKERAAAAGLGRPPSAAQEAGAPPAAAPAPAERPAPAARPAAAAGGGAGAAGLSPEQRQRLAAAVQRGPAGTAPAAAAPAAAAATASRPSPVADQRLVYVWPHLV